MIDFTLYEVGGHVRDGLLGIKSKDIDYSVVMSNTQQDPLTAFHLFEQTLKDQGYEIFLSTPDCFTIRGKFPEDHEHSGVADFVLARKELYYPIGTRQPVVSLGTLKDDLIRRDFTVNALARSMDGKIVDYFNGMKDLNDKILRTPTDAHVTFNDDPLRILRALRFSVMKDLHLSDQVIDAIKTYKGDFSVVSHERVREELNKMFMFDTRQAFITMGNLMELNYPLWHDMFTKVKLEPTLKS